jgi:hypothetical protein
MNKQHDFRQVRKRDVVGIAAEKCATHFTRRSVLCRFAYAAAAILGAQFLVAEGFRGTAWANEGPKCKLNTNATAGCSPTGLYCGFTGPTICSGGGVPTGCIQQSGCPAGTTPYGSWTACCQCPDQGTVGANVTYTDCCGTVSAAKCGNNGVGVPPPCPGGTANSTACPGCYLSDWCGNFVTGGGKYVCSVIKQGTQCTYAS